MRERKSKLGRMGKRVAEKQGCRQSGGGAEMKVKMPPEAGGLPHWRIPALPRSTSEMGSREWQEGTAAQGLETENRPRPGEATESTSSEMAGLKRTRRDLGPTWEAWDSSR